ncbi:MAG: hypothetical protein AB7W59_19950 [Acidimicrobiia bacterium]
MCRRISCSRCGKPSWAGCGAHVEQVLGDIAPADRCRCDEGAAAGAGGGGRKGVLGRLLGR